MGLAKSDGYAVACPRFFERLRFRTCGHVFIYQHLYWCGNGVRVTYGSAWQSYSQSGSYRLDQTYGPWWSGGCIGCSSLRASGYILWTWNAPLISIPQSGTSHLDTTMYAYGVLAY